MMPEILTPTTDADLGRLALIEAVRANTDAVNRMAKHGDKTDTKLDAVIASLGKIDTRLSLIEHGDVSEDVADLKRRVTALEMDKASRGGAKGLADMLAKFGPIVLAIVGAVYLVMTATGKPVL